MNDIYIKHKDWEGFCSIIENTIFRVDIQTETGLYVIKNNKLTIKWDKWNEEDFYYIDDPKYYIYKNLFDEIYDINYIFEKDNNYLLILNKNNNKYILYKNNNILNGLYLKENNILFLNNNLDNSKIIYKNISKNIYCLIEDFYKNIFFEIKIIDNSINEIYIFNKILKKFYNSVNTESQGSYEIIDNCLYMNWDNGFKKEFYSNKYISYDKINKNINIIKPVNIFIDNRVLFSNISLCKNKIILTSMHYKINKWNYNNLSINVSNCNIINKKLIDNNDEYESSTIIIIELDKEVNDLILKIKYNHIFSINNLNNNDINTNDIHNNIDNNINNNKIYTYEIYLENLNIKTHLLSAMTLFKDDYELLKRYLKYYNNLGIEIFFLYYNKKIDYLFLEEIIKINELNVHIYLIEWNYIYWWKDIDNTKYHHAQMMAINDSLNILKNYGTYTLYNDIDEYIINDNFIDFNNLIENNKDIDVFIFKNRFCKMGNDLIKYSEFDKIFDISKIIKGNYYDQYREKNIIKLDTINVMGVHKCFKNFSKNIINEIVISEFYHIINFEEKNRNNLMTEYVF
jgi:hypothetical protein